MGRGRREGGVRSRMCRRRIRILYFRDGCGWGFAGCALVIVLYLAFLGVALEIASSTRDHFGRLLVTGLATMVLFQAMINMYMTVQLGRWWGLRCRWCRMVDRRCWRRCWRGVVVECVDTAGSQSAGMMRGNRVTSTEAG